MSRPLPFCISRCTNATGIHENAFDQHLIDWTTVMPKFGAACRFAKTTGVTNILFTGRGEPTLYQNEISRYLHELKPYQFPFIEIQTNGIAIHDAWSNEEGRVDISTLHSWMNLGLTHVAVSMVHWDKDRNHEIYGGKSVVDLENLFGNLDQEGFSVRACLVAMKGYVDSVDDFKGVVGLCNSWGARQLRVAKIGRPEHPENKAVADWIDRHIPEHYDKIIDHVIEHGHYLRTLPHGAPVFDYDGLSVCLADCMPKENRVGNGMQPIFWPDGSLTYSWEHKGAVLL